MMKPTPEYWGKRLFDVVCVLILLLFCIPLFLIIGIAIKLDSPGTIFYKHPRVGKNGTLFKMWKFRTMVSEADKLGGGLTQHGDPRITKVGKLLRRASLDELPQIINVLLGEMSIVGPRPEIPEIVKDYTSKQREALTVRPGITGLTQVNGRDNLPIKEKLEMERKYVQDLTPWLDLKILFLTLPAIISGEGTRY